jgi:hypothetical protein
MQALHASFTSRIAKAVAATKKIQFDLENDAAAVKQSKSDVKAIDDERKLAKANEKKRIAAMSSEEKLEHISGVKKAKQLATKFKAREGILLPKIKSETIDPYLKAGNDVLLADQSNLTLERRVGSNKFWQLSDLQKGLVLNTMRSVSQRPRNDAFVKHVTGGEHLPSNITVENRDFLSLGGKSWLSNVAVDAAVAVIVKAQRSFDDAHVVREPVVVLTSSYYTALACPTHENARKRDIFERGIGNTLHLTEIYRQPDGSLLSCNCTDIDFLVWRPGHWINAIISPTQSTIFIEDSIQSNRHPKVIAVLANFFKIVYHAVYGFHHCIQWRIEYTTGGCQTDSSACGIFAAARASHYALTRCISKVSDFDQCDVEDLRYFIAYSLCVEAAAAGNLAVSMMPGESVSLQVPTQSTLATLGSTCAQGSMKLTVDEIKQLNLPLEDVLTLAAAGELMRTAQSKGPEDYSDFHCNSWIQIVD